MERVCPRGPFTHSRPAYFQTVQGIGKSGEAVGLGQIDPNSWAACRWDALQVVSAGDNDRLALRDNGRPTLDLRLLLTHQAAWLAAIATLRDKL